MLSLAPSDTILFQKISNSSEYSGNVEITNVSKKPITYKVYYYYICAILS